MFRKLLSLLSDAAVYGVSNVLSQVIGFLLLPLYTRFLTPADYGIVAMLTMVMTLFGPLANLGMTNAVFRRFNQAKDPATCRTVLGTGLVSVIFGSLALLVATVPFSRWIAADFVGDANTTFLVAVCLLSATFNTIGQVPNVTLRALRRVKTASGLNVARVVVAIGTTVLFVAGLRMGVKGWMYGILAADFVSLIMAVAVTWGMYDLRFSRDTWRSMISYGLPFVPHRLQAIAMGSFSQYMVRQMLGLGEAGIFEIAAKFAMPVGLAVNAIQEAWIPFKFQMHAQEADARPFFRSIFTYYFAAVTYLWVGVSLWGFDVVRLMTPQAFHDAAMLVPLLALLRVCQGVYFMMGTGLELTDRTASYPLVSLAGLVTVVVSAFVLVGPLGVVGAGLANVLSVLAMTAMIYWLAQRRFGIAYDWPTIGCFALLATGCVLVGYAMQPTMLWVRLAVYLVISLAYPVVALLLLVRSPSERERVRFLFFKLRGWRGLNPSA